MSDFGITAQPEGAQEIQTHDADRPRNWPLIRSPAWTVPPRHGRRHFQGGDLLRHRPGITSACAGCAILSPQDQGEDLGPAGFHLWGYHLRTSFFPEETLLVAGDAHGHRRTIALLPPVGRPHQGQEVHINKCDFFVEMGSPRPGIHGVWNPGSGGAEGRRPLISVNGRRCTRKEIPIPPL